jgi:hypothetical protein
VWHQKHLVETYEQYKEYCLILAVKCDFEAAEIRCVCSTSACEVLGTMKTAKAFERAEQYPRLCGDCNRAWHAVIGQRYHAEKLVASGLEFVEAHPMKSVEEFIPFRIVYSGRDKAEQELEPEQEPGAEPEEGGRGRRRRKPFQRQDPAESYPL